MLANPRSDFVIVRPRLGTFFGLDSGTSIHENRADDGEAPSAKTSGSMTSIRVKENEPFDVALRRFKRTIEKLGLLTDLRAREFYEKPTAERKRKKAAAVKRHFKRIRSMQLPKRLY